MSPGSLGRPVGREPSPVDVVRPGRMVDEEGVVEEADGSAEEAAADAEVCVVFAVMEVADLEGDVEADDEASEADEEASEEAGDEASEEAVGEALAEVSESLGRSWAAASEASRIETTRRESV